MIAKKNYKEFTTKEENTNQWKDKSYYSNNRISIKYHYLLFLWVLEINCMNSKEFTSINRNIYYQFLELQMQENQPFYLNSWKILKKNISNMIKKWHLNRSSQNKIKKMYSHKMITHSPSTIPSTASTKPHSISK